MNPAIAFLSAVTAVWLFIGLRQSVRAARFLRRRARSRRRARHSPHVFDRRARVAPNHTRLPIHRW